ncbi:serine/threonine-protein kinase [Micromonospora vulcania]|uniref:Protein kinase n=1 Tax=Micromonospora vulcania TaxID=1441873 RepID=A0ABW1H6S8_9ACTN
MLTRLTSDDPQQISGYRIRARLGAGGMGQVYLSFTPGGRAVALKVVRREYAEDGDFRQRFAQEVQAAQRVHGVYTAQVIDAGTDAGTPWLASAYVPGPTLLEAVREHGPLPVDAARSMIAAVAQSLQAIHAAGVVHRDLTPRNILLAADGPRVIDFGIARAIDATHLTISQTPIGTPSFMSPEQANGTSVAPASDVFTLAAVGFFAATGRAAFGEGNYLSVLRRVSEAEPDLTGCPAELRELFESCLLKDPTARPTTADIIEACGGAPRFEADWLPKPVAATVAAYGAALASVVAVPAPPVVRPGPSGPTPPLAAPHPTPRRRGRQVLLAAALGLAVLAGGVAIGVKMRPDSTGDRTNSSNADQPTNSPAAAQSATGTPPASPPASQVSPAPTTSGATTPGTAGAPRVQWTGMVRINDHGIDLDTVPPAVDPAEWEDVDAARSYSGGPLGTEKIAKWTGAGEPTPQQCRELVLTQGTDQLNVANKEVFCLRTSQARMALLVITATSGNTGTGVWATATVWEKASDS